MSGKSVAGALALTTMSAALFVASPAWAQGGGGPGCTNLPEYNRALGALQGMTSACDMSVAEACRILADRGTPAAACQEIVAAPRGRVRRSREQDRP